MIDAQQESLASVCKARELARPVTILIPTYGAADKLRICLDSLTKYLPPEGCTVYVLDDATPDDSVQQICREREGQGQQLFYLRSEANRGFVRTCNWGFQELFDRSGDLLILNSDTEVTKDFLTEMQEVLDLHEKHAAVTPRSNSATIFSVPFTGERLPAADAFRLWERLCSSLLRYQIMPTAVGFCMLLKGEILNRFQLFDEVYSPGYNEENDFVCRINRYGYSALAANRAFVYHHESSSFGARRAALEEANRTTLLRRYPEYDRKVSDFFAFYVDPLEHFAALYAPHKPRILFDLFHLPPAHNGTSEFALNLLREVSQLAEDSFDLYVGIGPSLPCFESELRGYKTFSDEEPPSLMFDLAFKPAQFFLWSDFERLNRRALRISFTLQDIIGVRCDYLNSPHRLFLFSKTAELSDHIFTISEFSRQDANRFYGTEFPTQVIHHGTSQCLDDSSTGSEDYILLVGNHYIHKGVEDAIEYIDPSYPVTVLGGSVIAPEKPNVRRLKSGHLTRRYIQQIFAGARLVIYPSHYEGFGLPVLDSLALGKPVIALNTAVNQELLGVAASDNLHLLSSIDRLPSVLEEVWQQPSKPKPAGPIRTWQAAGEEYIEGFKNILGREVNLTLLRARWNFLRTARSMDEEQSPVG